MPSINVFTACTRPRGIVWVVVALLCCWCFSPSAAADDEVAGENARNNERSGVLLQVPTPLRGEKADKFLQQLKSLALSMDAGRQQRTTVVLQFGTESSEPKGSSGADTAVAGAGSVFEDAQGIARFLVSPAARSMRTVAYLTGPTEGHSVLVVLACDEFMVAPNATLGHAVPDDEEADESMRLVYRAIAAGRGVIPEVAVDAMMMSGQALFEVTDVEGNTKFVSEEELAKLRESGAAWKEQQVMDASQQATFSANQLRKFRWASQIAADQQELAVALGLQKIVDAPTTWDGVLAGVRVNLQGPLSASRLQRIGMNWGIAVEKQGKNSLLMVFDTPGGFLQGSATLGARLADSPLESSGSLQTKRIGYIETEARGDAVLIALGCKPLWMNSNAVLGGMGEVELRRDDIIELGTTIDLIASSTGRSPALLRGLLDPTAQVERCVHRKTGEVGYFLANDIPGGEGGDWQRQGVIKLDAGLTVTEAIELGLVDGQVESLDEAASRAGFLEIPPILPERSFIAFIERMGQNLWLSSLLLVIGFAAFTMEASSPGIGVPGFVGAICMMLFFWVRILAGTAEWFEVMLFVGGVVFVAIELLVLPGFGIFGIGGLLMVVVSIVLASQTFVLPQSNLEMSQSLKGVGLVFVAFFGIAAGILGIRFFLPRTTLFKNLAMPGPNSLEMVEQEAREHLVHYEWLQGREGIATTPLRPAGKAMFDDELIAVVSDGGALSEGDRVRVIEVQGNRVVVEPITGEA